MARFSKVFRIRKDYVAWRIQNKESSHVALRSTTSGKIYVRLLNVATKPNGKDDSSS